MKAIKILLACIKKADLNYNLISNGDKIAVGISGGKDSIALLFLLNLYKKFSNTDFEIYPIFIDLGFPNTVEPLKDFIKTLGYDLIVADGHTVYDILKAQKEKQNLSKLPCSICSKMKKAIINKKAIELNCNKVSFAHHKDDALETLLLNQIYGGRIATFAPKMHLENDDITFIRPLIYARENDIKRLIKEENLLVFPSNCPNDKKTKREDIKNILNFLYKEYPSSEQNFLNMITDFRYLDVLFNHDEYKINNDNLVIKLVQTSQNMLEYINFYNKKCEFYQKSENFSDVSNNFHYALILENKEIIGAFKLNINDNNFVMSDYNFKNFELISKLFPLIIKNIYLEKSDYTLKISTKNAKFEEYLLKLNFIKKGDEFLFTSKDNKIFKLVNRL